MADPELQVDIVTRSLNQYVTKALLPHVRFSGGTGSMSALVHTSGGAMLLFCLGSRQLDGCVTRSLTFSFAAWLRLRRLTGVSMMMKLRRFNTSSDSTTPYLNPETCALHT